MLNKAAGESRFLPVPLQQQPQTQKQGYEECESNLLENADSVEKIKKTENDTPLTHTSKLKGSKQKATDAKLKTKTKTKMKIDEEQAMAHLQEQSHWLDEDTKLFLETLLGADNKFYKGLTSNAIHIVTKVTNIQMRLTWVTTNTIQHRSPNIYLKDSVA